MNTQQKDTLLKIAKESIISAVKHENMPKVCVDDPELNENLGCFVTIKNSEQLRGCIGQFTSDIALCQMVSNMAVSSAIHDPRFLNDPISNDELENLTIEISVLSPLKKTDDPINLELGTHGIYIVKGHNSGCFLPQVATETGWTKEQFLNYCCYHKAGLQPDAWKDADTEVYLFTCEVFQKPFGDI